MDTGVVESALVTGPFSLALRLAVRRSGLSLERVQFHLRERGVPISKTALSNWQSGRTQPERPESLRALAVLEDLLGVPRHGLGRLVGPPRPRGRWTERRPGDLRPDEAWGRPDGLRRALARLGSDLSAIDRMARVATHITCEVDGDRVLRTVHYRHVLRAKADGVDRYTIAYRSDLPTGCPDVTETVGCRRGRADADRETGFTTLELLLDRPLREGDMAAVSYRLHPEAREVYHSQRVNAGTRVMTVEAVFAPGVLPVRVVHAYRPSIGESDVSEVELPIGVGGVAQFVAEDPTPGIHRLAWQWA